MKNMTFIDDFDIQIQSDEVSEAVYGYGQENL